jgi:UDP-N-acetylmuramate dehydrogenase
VSDDLLARLPEVRGRYHQAFDLSSVTWFRVGGPADVLFMPKDAEDLAAFLKAKPAGVPVTLMGVGSNLLVRDGGLEGVTVRLGPGFGKIAVEEGGRIRAGAAALDVALSKAAHEAGLAGLEFYRGIPGSVGGALRMNAGSYGGETKDVLIEATVLDPAGESHVLPVDELGYAYRHCSLAEDWIFVDGLFQGTPGDRDAIAARMAEVTASREKTQPIKSRTGGSTFKNPEGHKSWQLIDAAGCRGLIKGGAQVSELHCNFLLNLGDATAADLEGLGEEVRARVREKSGVELDWEIKRIGRPAP